MPFFVISLLFLIAIVVGILATANIQSRIKRLSTQNRLLKALRSFDIAALSINDIEPLAQAIVNVIHQELGYTFAVIALVDYDEKLIRRVAISLDPKGSEVLKKIVPVQFKQQIVYFDNKENLFNKIIQEQKSMVTENLYDIQVGVMPREVSNRIMEVYNLKSIFLYPLWSRNKVVGILEYASTMRRTDIPELEFSIMNEFAAEVSRVLENAMLYSKLKETSEDLQIANVKLQQLDKLKDDFVSIASHELRTPMTAIRSYVWMALNRPDVNLTEKMKKYLSRTLLSTERLINLVNDMLNVSRIEAGRIEITPKAFNIVSFANEIMDEVRPKADEKKLQLFVVESHIPEVFADSDKVHEVLLNLVGNSLKFTQAGGRITISFFSDGKVIEISVTDTGQGISAEDIGRLFRKFERLDNSYIAASTSGGTGLGLYISKSLIMLMHGKIWAHSEGTGKGATFTFSLPAASQEILGEAEKYHIKPVGGEVKGLEPVAI